jgi:hypothetical protein
MSDNKWKKSGDEKIEHVTDPFRSALSHAAYVKVASDNVNLYRYKNYPKWSFCP